MNAFNIVRYPVSSEKAVRLMESDNKLTFIVDRRSNKTQIKKALEELFKVKVEKISSLIMPSGKKKVYVKLSPETPAIDLATKLGLI